MSEKADDDRLTGLDRLRMYLVDPDTFPVHFDDIDNAVSEIDRALQDERDGGWQDMSCAPRDGTIINAVGRYPEATAGFPRYVGYRDGKWVEFSRFEPQEIICWAWRPRGSWPSEPHTSKDSGV